MILSETEKVQGFCRLVHAAKGSFAATFVSHLRTPALKTEDFSKETRSS